MRENMTTPTTLKHFREQIFKCKNGEQVDANENSVWLIAKENKHSKPETHRRPEQKVWGATRSSWVEWSMRWGQRPEWRKRGVGHTEQPVHSSTSHSCPHLVTIHTIPTAESPSLTFTRRHTHETLNYLLSLMSRHICEHKHQKTHWNKGSYFLHHTQTAC